MATWRPAPGQVAEWATRAGPTARSWGLARTGARCFAKNVGPSAAAPAAAASTSDQTTGASCGATYATLSAADQAAVGPCALDSAYFGELVGRIGGVAFEIGDTTTIAPPASGTLELAVNDFVYTYGDNKGAFTVVFR